MTRRDDERLADILDAASAISAHTERGGLDDGLVFDTVRVRLIEIGEAGKALSPDLQTRGAGRSGGATSPPARSPPRRSLARYAWRASTTLCATDVVEFRTGTMSGGKK